MIVLLGYLDGADRVVESVASDIADDVLASATMSDDVIDIGHTIKLAVMRQVNDGFIPSKSPFGNNYSVSDMIDEIIDQVKKDDLHGREYSV